MKKIVFKTIEPKILYFGTPVALITTIDKDGNANIGPMSSVWALGWTLILGIGCDSKTYDNLIKQKECVVNFPSASAFQNVERIANLTGLNPVPAEKGATYRYEADKFKAGGFTALPSQKVKPPRIGECKLQFEAVVKNIMHVNGGTAQNPDVVAIEVKVITVHADEELIVGDRHIDPKKWDPLIYNFRHYYGLGKELGKTFKAEV
jgi:flavin reductase (DIM6/NTAB) family NADH-FMN oxidoreductase RutF